MKRDDQVPHDDTDNGEPGEEVGFCSYFQICDQFDELRSWSWIEKSANLQRIEK